MLCVSGGDEAPANRSDSMTTITFGKLTGSVNDGAKDMEIVINGSTVGLLTVAYTATKIGATRRDKHVASYVEVEITIGDKEITASHSPGATRKPFPVVDGNTAGAIRAAKAWAASAVAA